MASSGANAWVPEQRQLELTLEVLRASQSSSTATQQVVQRTLADYNQNPQFNRYLLFVLTQLRHEAEHTRSMAGICLKNNVRAMYSSIPQDVIHDVRVTCLLCLGESSELLRATIGMLITTIAVRGGLSEWPGLLQTLIEQMGNADITVGLGAIGALRKVCEDAGHEILTQNVDLLRFMFPKWIEFLRHENSQMRMQALTCLNLFVLWADVHHESVEAYIQSFLQGIYPLFTDTVADVRSNVVQALVTMYEVHQEIIHPYLAEIVNYMLISTGDADETVAQEACEFWLAISEDATVAAFLEPHLPQLLAQLLHHMRYTDMQIILLRGDEDDAGHADADEDIRPHHVRSRTCAGGGIGGNGGSAGRGGAVGAEDDEDEDEDDDGDNDAAEALAEWTLRKSASSSLDALAVVFGDATVQHDAQDNMLPNTFLETLLPLLQQLLTSPQWEIRESGILALGALSTGCSYCISPHLPTLLPFLIDCMSSEKSLIRSMSCWTVSRYSTWILFDGLAFFPKILDPLLRRVLDSNKHVQEAACSALAVLFEQDNSCEALQPYVASILQTLVHAHATYQRKNLIILYDAIMMLAEAVGGLLAQTEHVKVLMQSLLEKWSAFPEGDIAQFPLMECLMQVATALAEGFLPYCQGVHQRCVTMIQAAVLQQDMAAQGAAEEPEGTFFVVPLDLLSAVAEAIGPSVETLVSQTPILQLIESFSQSTVPEVRQSAFALYGDYTRWCFPHVHASVGRMLPVLARNLEPQFVPVCNNAAWAIGQLAMKLGSDMLPALPMVLPKLMFILSTKQPTTLLENAAVTIGRLGLVDPGTLAQNFDEFFKPWCMVMRRLKNSEEKYDTFRGICNVVIAYPDAVTKYFILFCDALCTWSDADLQQYKDLHQIFSQILQFYKSSMGPRWPQFWASVPDEGIKSRLVNTFGC